MPSVNWSALADPADAIPMASQTIPARVPIFISRFSLFATHAIAEFRFRANAVWS
jgi:hypothetical protein